MLFGSDRGEDNGLVERRTEDLRASGIEFIPGRGVLLARARVALCGHPLPRNHFGGIPTRLGRVEGSSSAYSVACDGGSRKTLQEELPRFRVVIQQELNDPS
jgi:hypothetical protein